MTTRAHEHIENYPSDVRSFVALPIPFKIMFEKRVYLFQKKKKIEKQNDTQPDIRSLQLSTVGHV